MLHGFLFAGNRSDLGFLGGAKRSPKSMSNSNDFVKSISGSGFFFVTVAIHHPKKEYLLDL